LKYLNALLPALLLFFLVHGCIRAPYQSTTAKGAGSTPAGQNDADLVGNDQQKNIVQEDLSRPDREDEPSAKSRRDEDEVSGGATGENTARALADTGNAKKSTSESQATHPNRANGKEKNHPHVRSSKKSIQSVLDEALDFCQLSQVFWQKGEFENAIEALDQAYSLIIGINNSEAPEVIQQKEDLRFMISKRILEIYASRNIVVSGNHNAIPMLINKHIQAEIDRFTTGGERKFFIESYQRSGKFRQFIVKALKEAGLPTELSWLPLIESGFKVDAMSRARALGLWQFISSTGYKFGLKRDKYIDERLDPIKSTNAAIEYLKELHKIFGDWTTVLAAYNCGEGQVLRVIRTQNINYLDNFWDLYERLPSETARYVPRFMATLHIVNNPEKYGLTDIPVEKPLLFETVTIAKQIHLKNVAKEIGVDEKTLKELNPELRYKILPQDKYPLRVPPGKGKILLARLDRIPVSHPPRRAYVYHRIRPGESLSTIAARYHTSIGSIARANNIRRRSLIVAGKTLKIPRRGYTVYTPTKSSSSTHRHASRHVVKSGDSLWIIAKRYGTTTKKIQEENNLTSTNLSIGQILKIPGSQDEKPVIDDLSRYTVKRGDSPFQIAQRHKMTLERFLRINQLTPRSKIYPGQQLLVE
jgi:membrane-bound lytic murein transglycosylase D